jgi:hypothetical protein
LLNTVALGCRLRVIRSYGVVENNMIEPTAGDATGNRSEENAAAPRRLEIRSAIAVLPDPHLRRDLPVIVGVDEALASRRQVVCEHVAVTDDRDLGRRIRRNRPARAGFMRRAQTSHQRPARPFQVKLLGQQL